MKLVMANFTLFLVPVCLLSAAFAQNSNTPPAQTSTQPTPIPIWANGAPGSKGNEPQDIPSIQLYQPPAGKASGAAIVVCPGGGYARLAPHEGHDIAVWLNGIGVTAIVLKYRLGPRYQHPVMKQDVLRAIRYTRSKASEWKIDPNRIGVMGFSAGGHLASTAATQFDVGDPNASDPIDKLSSRPDVAILCYPVITMTDPFTHQGSRRNLLGENPPQQLIDLMSTEKQVIEQTPPTFLFHTGDDAGVPVENSLKFVLSLRQKKVPYELHVYEHGRHGVGLAKDDPALSTWPKLLENWLRARGFVNQPQRVEAERIKFRHPELVRLIDELRVTPPEFAADSMIKLSGHPQIDDDWKKEILEEAFKIAFGAQNPYKMKYLDTLPPETRTGYKGLAFDLRMDRMSLQLLAIINLLRLDPLKARVLWNEMEKQKLVPLVCEDSLVYDMSLYYIAITEMARRAFTREETQAGEDVRFVDSHMLNIASPVEVIEAAKAIKEFHAPQIQFNAVVETFARSLENVAKDNRSFWVKSDEISTIVLALAAECDGRKVPPDFLIGRFRSYLAEQLNAPRCADNLIVDGKRVQALPPKSVADLNRVQKRYESIPQLTGDDTRPRKTAGAARIYPYWKRPQSYSLYEKIGALRFGNQAKQLVSDKQPARTNLKTKPPTPLSFEERQSSQWQYQLSDFLSEFSRWKPEHEATKDDYFHQKCHLFNNLLELAPTSRMRLTTIADYMAYLEQNRFDRESFIEWYLHVTDLMRRLRVMEAEERDQAIVALRDSNDQVLQLSVKLMLALEVETKASHEDLAPSPIPPD